MHKILTLLVCVPLFGCVSTPDALACPASVKSGKVSVAVSYSSGKCGYPLRDSRDRLWVNSTDYYVPRSSNSGVSLACRIHSFRTSRENVGTVRGQTYVDISNGRLTSKLPASCESSSGWLSGGPVSLPGQ